MQRNESGVAKRTQVSAGSVVDLSDQKKSGENVNEINR